MCVCYCVVVVCVLCVCECALVSTWECTACASVAGTCTISGRTCAQMRVCMHICMFVFGCKSVRQEKKSNL